MKLHKEDARIWALAVVGRMISRKDRWGGDAKLVTHARIDIINAGWVFEVEGVDDGFYPNRGFGKDITSWKLCDGYGRQYTTQPTNAQFFANPNWPNAESDSPRVEEGQIIDASYSEKPCDCPLPKLMSLGCSCGGI